MKRDRPINVFYVLLVVAGILFALTAFAYFVMAARARTAAAYETSALMGALDRHGGLVLAIELALLAACTFGAIAWDQWFDRRPPTPRQRPQQPET